MPQVRALAPHDPLPVRPPTTPERHRVLPTTTGATGATGATAATCGTGETGALDVTPVPRRILAVRSDSVGDVLLAGPAVRALSQVAPVTVLAGPIGAPAAALLPGVDEVLVHACAWIDANRPPVDEQAIHALVADVRRRPIDLAVIFTSSRQSPLPMALVLRLAGVPRIVARSTESPGSMVDVCLRSDDDQHEVERNLALVTAAGIEPPEDLRLRVVRPHDSISDPAVTALPSGRFVVVHPGSSVPARTMTADRWTAVVRGLRRAGWPVVLTGTASDATTASVRAALRLGPAVVTHDATHLVDPVDPVDPDLVDLVDRTDLGVLAEVIGRASVLCVGNTGPMHLAAAVGTPIVAAFAPTVPLVRWHPWMVPHVVVGRQDVACIHCHLRTCALPEQRCLAVDPGEIVDAVRILANRAGPAEARDLVQSGHAERCA